MPTDTTEVIERVAEISEPSRAARWSQQVERPVKFLSSVPHVGVYIGLLVIASGGALIALAWGRTAGLANVGLQMPYVMSAGFTGLALGVVGLAIVGVATEREDATDRSRQLEELKTLLRALHESEDEESWR